MEKLEKSKGKMQNSLMENEQKLRKLTKDVFHQVKICCIQIQLFIQVQVYMVEERGQIKHK